MTAQYDVLHDEGKALADALSAAGNSVVYEDYAGMIHGFFGLIPMVDSAVAAQTRAVDALKQAFA